MGHGNEILNEIRNHASGCLFREVDEYRGKHLWRKSIDSGNGCGDGRRCLGDRDITDFIRQALLDFEGEKNIHRR